MDSPPDVFQHTLLLFKDACPTSCLWWHDLHCGKLLHNANAIWDTYTVGVRTQSHSHTRTGAHKQTLVSRKCIPLLKGRLPAQLIPAYFALFPFMCVRVCMWVCAHTHVYVSVSHPLLPVFVATQYGEFKISLSNFLLHKHTHIICGFVMSLSLLGNSTVNLDRTVKDEKCDIWK